MEVGDVKAKITYRADKIRILYQANAEIQAAIEANLDYIKNEVLANEILEVGVENGVVLEEGELEGVVVEVEVTK